MRAKVSEFREELGEAWRQLEPVLAIRPDAAGVAKQLGFRFRKLLVDAERLTGADFGRSGVIATIMVDLDATGGPVVSAVVRGALPAEIDEKEADLKLGTRRFTVDSHVAYRGGGMAWAFLPQRDSAALVIGDERGLKRQLRTLVNREPTRGAKDDDDIARLAGQLRQEAPFAAAFVLPPGFAIAGASDFLPILQRVESGTLIVRPGEIEAHLVSPNQRDQETVAHGLAAAVAGIRAVVSLLEASAELLAGLEATGRPSELLPKGVRAKALEPILQSWVQDFRLDADVRRRPPFVTEASIALSSFRGVLAACLLVMGDVWKPLLEKSTGDLEAEVVTLLIGLRAAQMLHKEIEGRYVACGPTPAEIPTAAVKWPADRCFERLAFTPSLPVRVQLEAQVTGDRLLLVARSNPDGSGVPQVWYLSGDTDRVRGLSRTRKQR